MSEIEQQFKQRPLQAVGRERQVMVITAALAAFQFVAAYRALTLPDSLAAQISLVLPLEAVAALAWGLILSAATWRVAGTGRAICAPASMRWSPLSSTA